MNEPSARKDVTPHKRISRRTFVQLGAGAVSAAMLGSFGFFTHQRWEAVTRRWSWLRSAYLPLEARISLHYHYLQLDPAGVQQFVRDYEKHRGQIGRFWHDDNIFLRYLLSTDFFPNGADESRPVRYVMLYDPYVSPCWNPCIERS